MHSVSKVPRQAQKHSMAIQTKHQQRKGLICIRFDGRTDIRKYPKGAAKKEIREGYITVISEPGQDT